MHILNGRISLLKYQEHICFIICLSVLLYYITKVLSYSLSLDGILTINVNLGFEQVYYISIRVNSYYKTYLFLIGKFAYYTDIPSTSTLNNNDNDDESGTALNSFHVLYKLEVDYIIILILQTKCSRQRDAKNLPKIVQWARNFTCSKNICEGVRCLRQSIF